MRPGRRQHARERREFTNNMEDNAVEHGRTLGRERSQRRWGRVVAGGALLGLLAGAALTVSGPSRAQPAVAADLAAGNAAWGRGGCSNCHGGIANGGGGGEYPVGPNLRETVLDRDQLAETIACGRPVSGMPANLTGAYTEVACYGMPVPTTLEAAGVEKGAGMTQAEVDALADFLIAHVVGKMPVTRQNCAVFYGGNVDYPTCAKYPLE